MSRRRMRPGALAAVLGGALVAAIAVGAARAQQGPESLLPPGFDRPAPRAAASPRATPTPRVTATPTPRASHRAAEPAAPVRVAVPVAPPPPHAPAAVSAPPRPSAPMIAVAPSVPVVVAPPPAMAGGITLPPGIASFDQLAALPPDQLDLLLGLRSRDDIPQGERRALRHNGLIDASEGGLPGGALARQDGDLVRAAIAGNTGALVSRWGHILLRRALASRLDAPQGMDPADFVALRVALLTRMGEGDAARAVAQDVDPDDYTPALTAAAVDAYTMTADFTGICPVIALNPAGRKDAQWQVLRAMCLAFSGAESSGFAQLDHMTYVGTMPDIDMRLAQKYAGAGGHGRRAVNIAWDKAEAMTPWRYALAIATGLTPPARLMPADDPYYAHVTALAPMVGLGPRADASDRAGAAGILSAAAMVDLYSQIYADDDVTGDAADRALALRDAYVATTPDDRLKAMQGLWTGAASDQARYGRMVLTAYAAARLPVSGAMASSAGDIVAAMLTAGLDRNAMLWAPVCEAGSQGWALLALAAPGAGAPVDSDPIETYRKADASSGNRRAAFLVAGLAGLGRITDAVRNDEAGRLGVDFASGDAWTRTIDAAARVGNPELVALLAGLGMQGDGWGRMTPRYLFHIVRALNRVGLGGEARMIAAEAVARG